MHLVENLQIARLVCDGTQFLALLRKSKPLTLRSLRKAAKYAKKIFLAWRLRAFARNTRKLECLRESPVLRILNSANFLRRCSTTELRRHLRKLPGRTDIP